MMTSLFQLSASLSPVTIFKRMEFSLIRYSRACVQTVQCFSGQSSAGDAKATQTRLRCS